MPWLTRHLLDSSVLRQLAMDGFVRSLLVGPGISVAQQMVLAAAGFLILIPFFDFSDPLACPSLSIDERRDTGEKQDAEWNADASSQGYISIAL